MEFRYPNGFGRTPLGTSTRQAMDSRQWLRKSAPWNINKASSSHPEASSSAPQFVSNGSNNVFNVNSESPQSPPDKPRTFKRYWVLHEEEVSEDEVDAVDDKPRTTSPPRKKERGPDSKFDWPKNNFLTTPLPPKHQWKEMPPQPPPLMTQATPWEPLESAHKHPAHKHPAPMQQPWEPLESDESKHALSRANSRGHGNKGSKRIHSIRTRLNYDLGQCITCGYARPHKNANPVMRCTNTNCALWQYSKKDLAVCKICNHLACYDNVCLRCYPPEVTIFDAMITKYFLEP